MVFDLNELRDNNGSRKKKTRRGRGISSGLGKTAGRGHKGQKARAGVAIKGSEGGQMPLHRRLPKRGFRHARRTNWCLINLHNIQAAIDAGKLSSDDLITERALLVAGLLKKGSFFARVLGKGPIRSKIHLHVPYVSRQAAQQIENAGGTVRILLPTEVETILPNKYKLGDKFLESCKNEFDLQLSGKNIMHMQTHISKNVVKEDDKFDLFVEIVVQDSDRKISDENLASLNLCFDARGATASRKTLPLTQVFAEAAKHNGLYKTKIDYFSRTAGEITLMIDVTYGSNIIIRRSHQLYCEPHS